MPAPKDLTGKRYGRAVVIKLYDHRKRECKRWELRCDCGEMFIRRMPDLTRGFVYECPNCVFKRKDYYLGGKKFGRLHIQHESKMVKTPGGHSCRLWFCKCECGNEKWIAHVSITRGTTVSCGCFMVKNNSRYCNETNYPRKTGHRSSHPAYNQWISMNAKCYNSKNQSYKRFGAEGYTVCNLWRNSAEHFLEWMTQKKWKVGLSLHIKDGKKEFMPSNCYLINTQELQNINRSKSHFERFSIEYKGKRLLLPDWAKEFGVRTQTLYKKMQYFGGDMKKVEESLVGSGYSLRRDDIKTEDIIEMYNSGMTVAEISGKLNFSGVLGRLRKAKVKMRKPQRRTKKK